MSADDDDGEWTETMMASARPMTQAKRARILSGLSQADFARTCGIPPEMLRDWEQRRSEPDPTAVVFLTAIVNDHAAGAAAHGETAA